MGQMRSFIYKLLVFPVIVIVWHALVWMTGVPNFIFPPPVDVFNTLVKFNSSLFQHALVTTAEILLGLLIGTLLGVTSAILLVCFERAKQWALPLMVISQSIPVFAIAPMLTLWLGYGMASKVAMAVLIIYFPVVAATYDGLRHTPDHLLDVAKCAGASSLTTLCWIRLPYALPSVASGVRVATSVAPIGAIVGEWVGSSHGLGYLMLSANGKMQTDLMFAALFVLCVITYSLYFLVSRLLDRCVYWQDDTS